MAVNQFYFLHHRSKIVMLSDSTSSGELGYGIIIHTLLYDRQRVAHFPSNSLPLVKRSTLSCTPPAVQNEAQYELPEYVAAVAAPAGIAFVTPSSLPKHGPRSSTNGIPHGRVQPAACFEFDIASVGQFRAALRAVSSRFRRFATDSKARFRGDLCRRSYCQGVFLCHYFLRVVAVVGEKGVGVSAKRGHVSSWCVGQFITRACAHHDSQVERGGACATVGAVFRGRPRQRQEVGAWKSEPARGTEGHSMFEKHSCTYLCVYACV